MKKSLLIFLATAALMGCSNFSENPDQSSDMQNPAGYGAEQPYLFNAGNSLFMTWQETEQDTLHQLRLSEYDGQAWSQPVTLASGHKWFINWADFPNISVNASKNFIAHFLPKSGEGTFAYDVNIVLQDTTFKLHDDTVKGEHGFVSSVPYGKDKFFVSWLDGRNASADGHHHMGAMNIRAAIINVNGTKEQEWLLDDKVCDCCQTSTAITSEGPIVVYRDRSGEEFRDISYRRYVNDSWTPVKKVADDQWKITGCPVNGPKVVAKDDLVVITWYTGEGNQPKVKAAISTNSGETFSAPTIVSQNTLGRLDLALYDDEIWISHLAVENGATKLKAIRYDEKLNRLNEYEIASIEGSRKSGFPQMEVFDKSLYFAWTNSGDSTTIVSKKLQLN